MSNGCIVRLGLAASPLQQSGSEPDAACLRRSTLYSFYDICSVNSFVVLRFECCRSLWSLLPVFERITVRGSARVLVT